MKGTTADILLIMWLVTSTGFWLVGFAFFGRPYLPPLNAFTVGILYAPWLILAAAAFVRWRSSI